MCMEVIAVRDIWEMCGRYEAYRGVEREVEGVTKRVGGLQNRNFENDFFG